MTEQFNDGLINKEYFLNKKTKIKSEIDELRNNIDMLEIRTVSELNFEVEELLNNVKKYLKQEQLSQEMIETFIDKIILFDNQHFEIKWKFSNEFFNKQE